MATAVEAEPIRFPAGVRLVAFDVVGTLLVPTPSVAEAYRRVAARHGIERSCELLRKRFREAWREQERIDAESSPAFATSRERERERWRRIVVEVFEHAPEAERIFKELWDHFGSPAAWSASPHGGRLLAAADAAGLEIVLASNFDERLLEIAPAIPLLARAERVFASSEIGWRKPSPAFFRFIERATGRQPGEILMVGDDAQLDAAAARRAGWQAMLLQPSDEGLPRASS